MSCDLLLFGVPRPEHKKMATRCGGQFCYLQDGEKLTVALQTFDKPFVLVVKLGCEGQINKLLLAFQGVALENEGCALLELEKIKLLDQVSGYNELIDDYEKNFSLEKLRKQRHLAYGFGYDRHPLIEGRSLFLAGKDVPSKRGLQGHSDADIICHAVADALLSACNLGDIGTIYPATEEKYKNSSGLWLLDDCVARLGKIGALPTHVVVVLNAQEPRLAPYRAEMSQNLTAVLGCSVNITFKSGESIGFIGRGEGMACYALATVSVVD